MVGLGGGGLLGGVSFVDVFLAGLSTSATGSIPALTLLRTCATGVRLLILLGRSGLGFGVLLPDGPAFSASR